MKGRRAAVGAAGALVVFFAIIHLYLNLYIMAGHFTLAPDVLRVFITSMSRRLGPVAIPEDMGLAVFFIKVLASLSFLAAGAGLMAAKRWSVKTLIALLALRLAYGIFICVRYGSFHPHLGLIAAEFVFFAYFLTRRSIKEAFVV